MRKSTYSALWESVKVKAGRDEAESGEGEERSLHHVCTGYFPLSIKMT